MTKLQVLLNDLMVKKATYMTRHSVLKEEADRGTL